MTKIKTKTKRNDQVEETNNHQDLSKKYITIRDPSIHNIIQGISKGVTNRDSRNKVCNYMTFFSN